MTMATCNTAGDDRFAGVYRMSGTATAYDIHPDGKHERAEEDVQQPDADQ
jgi:hypothetical protein